MQKAVLRLVLHDEKDKKKAMKTVSGFAGVDSIDINMKENKLTVTGAIDPVVLVGKLRKLFSTDIVSVGPAKEAQKKDGEKKDDQDKKKKDDQDKKNEQSKESKPDPPKIPQLPYWYYQFPPPPPYYPIRPSAPPPPYYYGKCFSVEEDPNACVIC